jgi:hypothetical protein
MKGLRLTDPPLCDPRAALAPEAAAKHSRSSILNEERDDARRWRAAAVIYVRDQLTRALELMGIGVPQRM